METDHRALVRDKKAAPVPIRGVPKEEPRGKFKRQLNEDIFGAEDVVKAPKRAKAEVIEEISTPAVRESSRN